MLTRTVLLALLLICAQLEVPAQRISKARRVRTAALHHVGEYPNRYLPGTFKIRNVVLEDVRRIQDHWVSVLQLYDPRTRVRRGEAFKNEPFHPHDFLICTSLEIGKPLFEQREKWLKQRVNVYVEMQDVGLTVFVYTGYVTRIELLGQAGQVVEAIQLK